MTQKLIKGALNHRFLSVKKSQIDEKIRTIEIPFSSEEPVETWWGTEILSHDDGAPNLERVNQSGSLLFNHDFNQLIGVVERVYLLEKRLYARLRFSESDEAEKCWKQVLEGVLRNVSFTYSVEKYREEKGVSVGIAWTVYEVSMVSVPADPTVGLGRSQGFQGQKGDQKMTEVAQKYSVSDETQFERERCREISGIGRMLDMPDLAEKGINEGWTIEQAKSHFFDAKNQRLKRESYRGGNIIQSMSRRELQSYSLVKALRAAAEGDTSNSFEREVSEQIKRDPGVRSRGGLHVPSAMLLSQRSVLKAGSGADLIESTLMDSAFIETLRAKTLVGAMGATYLQGLVGDVEIPRQASAASISWVGESEALSESQPEFDNVTLEPKQIGAITRISRLMLQQSTPAIEDLVRSDLSQIVAIGIDAAAIAGTGSSNQPLGILRNPDVGIISLGTNGGALDWDAILELERSISSQNADGSSMGFLTNSSVRKVLKSTLMNPAATNSDWIWSDEAMMSQVAGAA